MEESSTEKLWAYYESPWVHPNTVHAVIRHLGQSDVEIIQVVQHQATNMVKVILSLSPVAIDLVKRWGEAR